MAVLNGDWSVGGPGPGDADAWVLSGIPKGEYCAEYTETDPPVAGDLVVTCRDTFSVEAVADPMLSELAEYTQNDHDDPDDRVEDFEAEWPAGAWFYDDLVGIEGAEYVDEVAGGTQPVEDFELVTDASVLPADAAQYIDEVHGGTQAGEDFERIADGSIFPATGAIYEGSSLWESFNILTFWTDPEDQMTTM